MKVGLKVSVKVGRSVAPKVSRRAELKVSAKAGRSVAPWDAYSAGLSECL